MAHRNDPKAEAWSRPTASRGAARPLILVALALGILAAIWLLPLKQLVLAVLQWIDGLGVWGPVFLAGFYIVAPVLFLPGSIITLAAGALFGVTKGFLAVWVGANLGACAAFIVGRTLARDWIAGKVAANPKFAIVEEAIAREGFKIVLLLRLSPVFPFNLLNYALGLTRVSLANYALASLIGMIPGALMYVYLGSVAGSLAAVAAGKVEGGLAVDVLKWAGLAFTVIATLFVTSIARRSLAAAEASVRSGSRKAAPEKAPEEHPPPDVTPKDAYNNELVENVRPAYWKNPEPDGRYNLVVIGAGTAGLVTAAGAAGLGAKVALVESHLLGGDCLNYGCVPSKSLIRSSRVASDIGRAGEYGIKVPPGEVDFTAVMERMRRLRASISHHDSAERFKGLGVDVFLGNGLFTGPSTVEVAGKTLRFRRAVIATGARPVHPRIRGLQEAGFRTNETIFSLTERPARLAVIGAGPIGCEMAQTFQRLGCQVILLHKNDHILDREDADAAEIVQKRFVQEGIHLVLKSSIKVVAEFDGEKVIHFEIDGREEAVAVDGILVGAGRAPNVAGLNLEAAGVQYDSHRGVFVNDYLQTTNPRIYAAGDVCMAKKFTHAADAAARIVIQNALFKGSKKLSSFTVPWCTYTDPEIAHVGMYERDAASKGIPVETFLRPLREVDRAVIDGEEDGFVKIHVKKGTDKIIGATIVAAHAGEMIGEISVAMAGKIGLSTLSGVIHPYPTQAEAIKHAADAWNRTRLTPFLKALFTKWLSWTR